MKENNLNEKLEREREKLSRLAEKALKNNVPFSQDEAVIAQSRKIDALVVKVQKVKEKQSEARQER